MNNNMAKCNGYKTDSPFFVAIHNLINFRLEVFAIWLLWAYGQNITITLFLL
jgi:hypothetical protein